MHRLFSWTADAVGCWSRLVVGVALPVPKDRPRQVKVDYSAKCAPAFAPAHTIHIDIHHRHALTCDLRIPNPAWFRDSTDLFFHFFLSQPGRKACFYPPPPGLFFYGAPSLLSINLLHCGNYKGQGQVYDSPTQPSPDDASVARVCIGSGEREVMPSGS